MLDGNRNTVHRSFNPCFNGSMYKNEESNVFDIPYEESFNPCFNGSMYKNYSGLCIQGK